MRILVIGNELHAVELKAKLGDNHAYVLVNDHRHAEKVGEKTDLIFDFLIEERPDQFQRYVNSVPAFLNTAKISLSELIHLSGKKPTGSVFGFNGLPTFINRAFIECACWQETDEPELRKIAENLGTQVMIVDDRVGLVTPRVVCMIINEAYYTVQEGTASREDIDMAMKLGTNYPFGPFEWSQRIGVHHVYELLEAVYDDTRDERYKICPLLKKEYLKTAG
ncbi:MAG TPA: 3-hydroxyacyl-CoA dehydrogenase family protein [Chryseosolibacter sp.]|nr:3-hydroxyacyl-CoA dehydrogenase family protein [Chryseosolibacter sp.]